MTACTKQPFEAIVPYVRQPEELVPGQPIFLCVRRDPQRLRFGPLLVESHEGRPIKIEGNADIPPVLAPTDVSLRPRA